MVSALEHSFFSLAPPSLLILTVIMRIREAGFWQNPELVWKGGKWIAEKFEIHSDSVRAASFRDPGKSYFVLNEGYGGSLLPGSCYC